MALIRLDPNTWVNPEHIVYVKSTGYSEEAPEVVVGFVGGFTHKMVSSATLQEVLDRIASIDRPQQMVMRSTNLKDFKDQSRYAKTYPKS